jgi:C4-dicarboxylate-specific signal transduction histidine kinase
MLRTLSALIGCAAAILSIGPEADRPASSARVAAASPVAVAEAQRLDPATISLLELAQSGAMLQSQHDLRRDDWPLVIAALVVILLQGFVIGGLLFERNRRRRAEQERQRQLAAIALLSRRDAMGMLTTSFAHELNHPLESILRNAEAAKALLVRGSPRVQELQEIVEGIRKDEKRAGEVIRHFRALFPEHDFEYQSLNINEVVADAAAVVAPDAASRGVRIDLDLQDATGVVWGDRMRLQQVMVGLIVNSIEAMRPISTHLQRLAIQTVFKGNTVSVLVHDTGPGFSAEPVSQVFEPFYTTKGDGRGVGLSIARSIVEAHGGHVAAEHRLGGGATVQVTVPLRGAGPNPR